MGHGQIFDGRSDVGSVSAEERAQLLTQKGATVWFTGLSASGKVRTCPVLGYGTNSR